MNISQRHPLADLRHPDESQVHGGERWSQWSSLPLIELNAFDTYAFVSKQIQQPGQRILEVGCGNGYLTLELARDGHRVIGLDTSPEIIEMAEYSRMAHPDTPGFGELTYLCADICTWQPGEEPFDVIIFNRTLHHIHALHPVLARVQSLLKSGGQLLCQDYAYDRLNEPTAHWVYAMQRLLFLSGCAEADPAVGTNEGESIEAFRTAWFQRAAHRLHRYEDMMQGLQTSFRQQCVSWVPYLYVYVANGMNTVPPEQERALIAFLKNMEQLLIERELIQAVGFRYIGIV